MIAVTIAMSACATLPEGSTRRAELIARRLMDGVEETAEQTSRLDTESSPKEDLQKFVDAVNRELAISYSAMSEICTNYFEARGDRTFVLVFRAKDESFVDFDTAVYVTEQSTQSVVTMLVGLKAMGIPYPVVVFEYLDMEGTVFYSREFSLDDEQTTASPRTGEESREILLYLVESQRSAAEEMERSLLGLVDIVLEARGENALVYAFYVKEYNRAVGLTERRILNEELPRMAETIQPVQLILAAMGIADPVVIIEFYAPDGSMLISKEIK